MTTVPNDDNAKAMLYQREALIRRMTILLLIRTLHSHALPPMGANTFDNDIKLFALQPASFVRVEIEERHQFYANLVRIFDGVWHFQANQPKRLVMGWYLVPL